MNKIKFKTTNDTFLNKSQSFNKYEDELSFDNEKKCVVKVGLINKQEELNSFKSSCLSDILDKFLYGEIPLENAIQPLVHKNVRGDEELSKIAPILAYKDELVEKYNIDVSIYDTPDKVFKYVEKLSQDNAKSLDEKFKKGSVKNGKKKEDFNEEVKKVVSKNSQQDSQEES